jgi:putative ATP-dependent endonuclease of the OLD family
MEVAYFLVRNYRSSVSTTDPAIDHPNCLNNDGQSTILRALVMSLEFVSRLGGMRIQHGCLLSLERCFAFYDWQKDYPECAMHSNAKSKAS